MSAETKHARGIRRRQEQIDRNAPVVWLAQPVRLTPDSALRVLGGTAKALAALDSLAH
jgi:hypothetical protein